MTIINTTMKTVRRETCLLLPDDEPPAANGNYIFSELCDFCWEHREYIFYKHSKYNLNDQKLTETFEEQQNRTCTYVDAMPEYAGEFRTARNRHPELRPYIKHLQ